MVTSSASLGRCDEAGKIIHRFKAASVGGAKKDRCVSTQRSFYDRPKEDCPFRKFHPAPRLARVVKPEAQSSVEPADGAHRDFAPSLATPCQALAEGIDLVVATPGKGEQFRREVLK